MERVAPNALSAPAEQSNRRVEVNPLHRLPTWEALAAIPEKNLRACQLGFRAKFISETARLLATRPGWLDETEALPYPAAKSRLLELPGVGALVLYPVCFLVGSEGTLGIVLQAEVELVAAPAQTVLIALGYDDMPTAADAVPGILVHKPVACEGIDRRIVDTGFLLVSRHASKHRDNKITTTI